MAGRALTCIAALGGLFAATASANVSLRFVAEVDGLAAADKAVLDAALGEVAATLPPALAKGIGGSVAIRFDRLDDTKALLPPSCARRADATDHRQRLGKTSFWNDRRIVLHSHLLPELLAGEARSRKFPCGHPSGYRLAKATIIHELAHLYDDRALKTPAERKVFEECFDPSEPSMARDRMTHRERKRCVREARTLVRTVSSRPAFRLIAGWARQGLFASGYSRHNFASERSPDEYEYDSAAEGFAVNMEFFLLDPDYKCRRPLLYSHLRDHFGFEPFPGSRCAVDARVYPIATEADVGRELPPVEIHPSRVYEIHYLLAAESDSLMSRWGHSMYRIIVCAPWRKTPGPECLKDVSHHLVLSFRANVDDVVVSYRKGLVGDYPSLLFVLRMTDVLREYTATELRELRSYPLVLNETEKARFLLATLSTQWDYAGKYKFLSTNCATEAFWFAQIALRDPRLDMESVLTPMGVLDALKRVGRVRTDVLADRNRALREGYVFASQRAIIDEAFGAVHAASGQENPEDWADETSAAQRFAVFERLGGDGALAAKFHVLENYFKRRLLARVQRGLVALLDEASLPEEVRKAFGQATDPRPWRRLATTPYGIPLIGELEPAASPGSPDSTTRELARKAGLWLIQRFPRESAEILAADQHMRRYRKRVIGAQDGAPGGRGTQK